jgi:hypothetical protein
VVAGVLPLAVVAGGPPLTVGAAVVPFPLVLPLPLVPVGDAGAGALAVPADTLPPPVSVPGAPAGDPVALFEPRAPGRVELWVAVPGAAACAVRPAAPPAGPEAAF